MNNLKNIPQFKSEKEEQDFWANHDSSEYLDWSQAKVTVLPNLKPSNKTISLRLPEHLLHRIKMAANKKDVPYQSLIKVLLDESLSKTNI